MEIQTLLRAYKHAVAEREYCQWMYDDLGDDLYEHELGRRCRQVAQFENRLQHHLEALSAQVIKLQAFIQTAAWVEDSSGTVYCAWCGRRQGPAPGDEHEPTCPLLELHAPPARPEGALRVYASPERCWYPASLPEFERSEG